MMQRATVLLIAAGLTLAGPAAGVETISGTITRASDSAPLVGIDLDLYDSVGAFIPLGPLVSDGAGGYTIVVPGPGTYLVRADAGISDGVVDAYFGGAFLKSAATPIAVGTGQAVSGIDFALAGGVTLGGQVTGSGVPLNLIDLDVFSNTGEFISGLTPVSTVDGTYIAGVLPAGSYLIRADPNPSLGQYLVRSFFGGSMTVLGATPVVVANSNVTGIDINLVPGGSISGLVTAAADGSPLVGFDIDLFDSLGSRVDANASTDATGAYEIGAVPTGSYVIRVDPTLIEGFAQTYHAGVATAAAATPVLVTEGMTVPNVDFALTLGAVITGTMQDAGTGAPVSGIDLDLTDTLGNRAGVTAKSGLDGTYQIGPILAGSYVLRADPTVVQGFARQYYALAATESTASLISLSAGQVTSGIDFPLEQGATISGTIVEASSGLPVQGIDLDLFDAFGSRASFTDKSDATGGFELGPLEAGSYLLRADPTIAQGFAVEYYLGVGTESASTPVVVSSGIDVTGIDFNLTPGATISGTITDTLTGTPQSGIDLDLFDGNGSRTNFTATSDVSGHYQIGPMKAGSYFLRADPALGLGLASLFYDNAIDIAFGTAIAAADGTDVTGVDFALNAAGSISGVVLGTAGLPAAGIDIDLFDSGTGIRQRSGASSAIDGTYLFDSLNPGTYTIRADATIAQGYALQYYNAKLTKALADVVTVPGSATVSNVSFALELGGTISGRVTPTGSPVGIEAIDIDIFQAGTLVRLDQGAITDLNGDYTLGGIPPGNYIVRADPAVGQPYTLAYHGGTADPATATTLGVSAGEDVVGVGIAVPEPGLVATGSAALLVLASLANRSKRTRHRH